MKDRQTIQIHKKIFLEWRLLKAEDEVKAGHVIEWGIWLNSQIMKGRP